MNRTLEKFVKEHELTVLSEKEQVLLDEYGKGVEINDPNVLSNCSSNNCHGGNCVVGCGSNETTPQE